MAENFPNWVLYPWFEEHGSNLIHPDDLDKFRALKPYGIVFRNMGYDDGYSVIEYGTERFRVLPELIQQITPMPEQMFELGMCVSISGKDCLGEVCSITWHHKKKSPMYAVRVNGKKKNKRYWPEELGRVGGKTS